MTMRTTVAQRPHHTARQTEADDHPIRQNASQQTAMVAIP